MPSRQSRPSIREKIASARRLDDEIALAERRSQFAKKQEKREMRKLIRFHSKMTQDRAMYLTSTPDQPTRPQNAPGEEGGRLMSEENQARRIRRERGAMVMAEAGGDTARTLAF